MGRLVGADLVDGLADVDHLLTALIITDDDVQPTNTVAPSYLLPADANGRPPAIVMRGRQRTARTRRNREFLAARAVELMRAAGARHVHRSDWPPLMLHIHSTMRMGSDAATSVLDEWSESRWVSGVFVVDNSALPNSLGGPNPTLTTQALATRAAERVLTKYFGGHSWVGTETPVSSIDPRVTLAVQARGL